MRKKGLFVRGFQDQGGSRTPAAVSYWCLSGGGWAGRERCDTPREEVRVMCVGTTAQHSSVQVRASKRSTYIRLSFGACTGVASGAVLREERTHSWHYIQLPVTRKSNTGVMVNIAREFREGDDTQGRELA
ncbi:unnamed protein product [Ectocarpus fasciculatus]